MPAISTTSGVDSNPFQLKTRKMADEAGRRLAREKWRWEAVVMAANSLSPSMRLAAMGIKHFINSRQGVCWAAYSTIAEWARVSVRTVEKTVAALKRAGLIKVWKQAFGTPNRIQLAMPEMVERPCAETPDSAAQSRTPERPIDGTDLGNHGGDSPIPPSLFDEPEDEIADPLKDTEIPAGVEIPESSETIEPTSDVARAAVRVGRAAARMLGWVDTHRLPDGRFADRAAVDALGEAGLAVMMPALRQGRLSLRFLLKMLLDAGAAVGPDHKMSGMPLDVNDDLPLSQDCLPAASSPPVELRAP